MTHVRLDPSNLPVPPTPKLLRIKSCLLSSYHSPVPRWASRIFEGRLTPASRYSPQAMTYKLCSHNKLGHKPSPTASSYIRGVKLKRQQSGRLHNARALQVTDCKKDIQGPKRLQAAATFVFAFLPSLSFFFFSLLLVCYSTMVRLISIDVAKLLPRLRQRQQSHLFDPPLQASSSLS